MHGRQHQALRSIDTTAAWCSCCSAADVAAADKDCCCGCAGWNRPGQPLLHMPSSPPTPTWCRCCGGACTRDLWTAQQLHLVLHSATTVLHGQSLSLRDTAHCTRLPTCSDRYSLYLLLYVCSSSRGPHLFHHHSLACGGRTACCVSKAAGSSCCSPAGLGGPGQVVVGEPVIQQRDQLRLPCAELLVIHGSALAARRQPGVLRLAAAAISCQMPCQTRAEVRAVTCSATTSGKQYIVHRRWPAAQ